MESEVDRLVAKVLKRFSELPPSQRLLIGIAGVPGSGKTSLSRSVTESLNSHAAAQGWCGGGGEDKEIAAFVPMDGFHLTRAQLSAMPDPATAHARRGAEFTFDGAGFFSLVRALREPVVAQDGAQAASARVLAPSFDHAVKDPVEDSIVVKPSHRIIVLEGNYLLLDRKPWSDAAALMDEKWFVDVDFEIAAQRLAPRHLAAGIVATLEDGFKRAWENDLVNGAEIVRLKLLPDETVVSLENPAWASAHQ